MSHNQTKESIALAKRLHGMGVRKPITFGVWFMDEDDPNHPPFLYCQTCDCDVHKELKGDNYYALYQIHDCLEWLRRKKFHVRLEDYGCRWQCMLFVETEEFNATRFENPTVEENADTPLEACLKAMIAVKEGEE